MEHRKGYNINRIENKKIFWYNIFAKVGGAVVLSLVVLGSVIVKTDPVKPMISASANAYCPQKVIIDAGHGGFDGGAVSSDGTSEKDINLIIAKKVAEILKIYGFDVVLTREDDYVIGDNNTGKIATRKKDDMVNRLTLINSDKNAVCVSVHLNKFTTSVPNGAQMFYGVKNPKSFELANAIQQSFKEHLQPTNNRVVKKGSKSIYLLYNAEIPMVIAECGFISNKNELSLLKTDEYQTKTALCISAGILNYFNG